MENESLKVQTPLRFNKELLKLIKEKAKAEKRSLNNYIEYLLYKDVGNIPNSETIKAIEEARSNKNLETISDLTSWLDEI
ncbi:hypothetical protein [uncultured Polaribacter sp.]|uniref:hypothetical protein n=1 Tax=uncultured Polaribacter sp. TaxID=174711 RepID=UPI0026340536|nr:hypothetical protein [uncultured Polaribacter sp.]